MALLNVARWGVDELTHELVFELEDGATVRVAGVWTPVPVDPDEQETA